MRHSQMTYSLTTLTQYQIPEAETFNLLGSKEEVIFRFKNYQNSFSLTFVTLKKIHNTKL